MFKHKYLLLIVITVFAGLLRFIALGSNPPSLNLDEVAIGYNAYSIIKTGLDEYGQKFPVAFRSHDDYKAPLYIYLTTIPISVFGLNAFAVRFISALCGTLTIPVFYLLINQLTLKLKKYRYLPLLSAFLLTISPWHIQYSRAAFETNLALFLVVAGVLLYLYGKTRPKLYLAATAILTLSIYAYHTNKLFVPVIFCVMLWENRKLVRKQARYILLSVLTFILIIAPMVPFMLKPESRLRLKGTSVFETPTLVNISHDQKLDQWRLGREYEAKIFHDERIAAFNVFLKGFFTHFTFDFLFGGEYGPPKNYTPNVGLLYLWQLPLILWGVYAWFKNKFPLQLLLIVWMVASVLASALTWDVPSSTRTLFIVAPYQFFSALGAIEFITFFKTGLRRKLAVTVLCLFGLYYFADYLHNYYRIAPVVNADAYQSGYKEAVAIAAREAPGVDRIIVSTRLKQPQNFFAFYLKYDPATYIFKDGGTVSGGFNETKNHFDKYFFHPISWDEKDMQPRTLYIDINKNIDNHFQPVAVINLPNQQPGLFIYKNP